MIFAVEISETLNDVILVGSGAIIGIVAQPIVYILKKVIDAIVDNKKSKKKNTKHIYKIINIAITDFLDKAENVYHVLSKRIKASMSTFDELDDLLEELKESFFNLRDYRISIEVINNSQIISMTHNLISHSKSLIVLLNAYKEDFHIENFDSNYSKAYQLISDQLNDFNSRVQKMF